jgi:hypothetical protein
MAALLRHKAQADALARGHRGSGHGSVLAHVAQVERLLHHVQPVDQGLARGEDQFVELHPQRPLRSPAGFTSWSDHWAKGFIACNDEIFLQLHFHIRPHEQATKALPVAEEFSADGGEEELDAWHSQL